MKRKCLLGLVVCLLFFGIAGFANAVTLTFDTNNTPGITLWGGTTWSDTGGGHLYNEYNDTDDSIDFAESVYLNDFQMNAMPWEDYAYGDGGFIDIEARDASGSVIWSTTADLTNYTAWGDWLTISVETANVARLYFYGPAATSPHYDPFFPSIDNVRINEDAADTPIPEPSTVLLLGAGLLGLVGYSRKRSKN